MFHHFAILFRVVLVTTLWVPFCEAEGLQKVALIEHEPSDPRIADLQNNLTTVWKELMQLKEEVSSHLEQQVDEHRHHQLMAEVEEMIKGQLIQHNLIKLPLDSIHHDHQRLMHLETQQEYYDTNHRNDGNQSRSHGQNGTQGDLGLNISKNNNPNYNHNRQDYNYSNSNNNNRNNHDHNHNHQKNNHHHKQHQHHNHKNHQHNPHHQSGIDRQTVPTTSMKPQQANRNHYQQTGNHHQQRGNHHQQPGSHHQQTSNHHQQSGSHHQQAGSHHHRQHDSLWQRSVCSLQPNSETISNVHGSIVISQKTDKKSDVFYNMTLAGFPKGMSGPYLISLHKNKLDQDRCSTAGPFLNPRSKTGSRRNRLTANQEDGLIGSIDVVESGIFTGYLQILETEAPFEPTDLIHRSIVIHSAEKTDQTSMSREAVACCTVKHDRRSSRQPPLINTQSIRFNG